MHLIDYIIDYNSYNNINCQMNIGEYGYVYVVHFKGFVDFMILFYFRYKPWLTAYHLVTSPQSYCFCCFTSE